MRIILFVIFISCSAGFSKDIREITISVGDQYPVEFEEESYLSVNRKGIVDVFAVGKKSFKIIALKPGFVSILVSMKDAEKRVLVTVEKRKKSISKASVNVKFSVESIMEIYNSSAAESIGRSPLNRFNYQDLKSAKYNRHRIGSYKSQMVVQQGHVASSLLNFEMYQYRQDSMLGKFLDRSSFKSQVKIEKSSRKGKYLCKIKIKRSTRSGGHVAEKDDGLFNTSVVLKTKKLHGLGIISLGLSDQNKINTLGLSSIPIIGPLFRLRSKKTLNIMALYFFKITELN